MSSRNTEHRLKSWPAFFASVLSGEKTFELRRSSDRDFHVGDTLILQEFDPVTAAYSGREARVCVTYILDWSHACAVSEAALHQDFSILSIRHPETEKGNDSG